MAQILFLFTNDFPFGKDETFIENELPILSAHFDKVVIISNDCTNNQTRTICDNVAVERSPYHLSFFEKIKALKQYFSKEFKAEKACIRDIYKKQISLTIAKTVLFSIQKSIIFQKRFSQFISKHTQSSDAVFAYSYWADDTAYALTLLKKTHPNIKFFTRMHRWDVYFDQNECDYLPFRKPIFEQMDAVFSISENGKSYVEKMFGQSFPNIIVSRLGVPEHRHNPGSPEVFTIVSISNIIPVKNLTLLIKALAKVNFEFRWIHIGNGSQRPEIELLSEHFISGKYQFMGQKNNAEVIEFLEETPLSILINVSKSEGIPVSIMEAFSCGIPVLALDVGGNNEIVSNETGRLLPASADDEMVAKSLTDLQQLSKSDMNILKENAYKCWMSNYNSKNNYSDFIVNINNLS